MGNTNRSEKILEIMEVGQWYSKDEVYGKLPRAYKGGMTPKIATLATLNRLARMKVLKKKSQGRLHSSRYEATFMNPGVKDG